MKLEDRFKKFPKLIKELGNQECGSDSTVIDRGVSLLKTYPLLIIKGTTSDFTRSQKLAVHILKRVSEDLQFRRPCVYSLAFDLGNEQYSDHTPTQSELLIANGYILDILEGIPPSNQKFVGAVIGKITEAGTYGIITTAIQEKQWKSVFDNSIEIYMRKAKVL